MICFLPWAAESKQCKNLVVSNTLINARARPGGFYLQTKNLEFIESVLVTVVKKREKMQWTLLKRLMRGCKSSWQLRFLSEVLFNMYGKRNAGEGTKFSYELLKDFVSSKIMKWLKHKFCAAKKAKYSRFMKQELVPGNRSKMISWVFELSVV